MLRTLTAFFVAPVPMALFQSAMVALWPNPAKGIFQHPASMFVLVCLLFYIFELMVGLPAWVIVRRRGATLKAYLLIGLLAALLPAAMGLLGLARGTPLSAHALIYDLLLFGLGGVAAGALFWLIAGRTPPGRDLKETFS